MTKEVIKFEKFYKELARKVLKYKDNSSYLVELLKNLKNAGIPIIRLKEKDTGEDSIELKEIDPFSFFANFNRGIKYNNRIKILEYLKKEMKITSSIPTDFDGIPVLNNQRSWFFSYKEKRKENDISLLWTLFEELINDRVSSETFNKCLEISGVKYNITIAFFWLNPDKYIALDKNTISYLQKELNLNESIDIEKMKYEGYVGLLKKIQFHFKDKSIYEIVQKSYEQDETIIDLRKEKLKIKNKESEVEPEQTLPLNKILYGPPGTGKTYHTINKALEILGGNIEGLSRTKIKEKYEEYVQAGQILFTTFHQSYSYEEFVEGIKALPPGSENNPGKEMIYKAVSGIYKKVCAKAYENFENSLKTKEIQSKDKILKQKVDEFLSDSFENETEFTKTQKGKFKITQVDDSVITVETEDSKYSGNIVTLDKKEFLKVVENLDKDYRFSKQMAVDLFGVNSQRQKDTYYFNLSKEFKKYKTDDIKENNVEIEKLKNYVLIIDEINRGNISKIFGELITLIEDSKRLGNPEQLKVKLPYSGEEFGVPKNLYIIGTMNTADRSIALMDTALRRRFQFEEMMPKLALLSSDDKLVEKYDEEKEQPNDLKVGEINIRLMLKKINERIEYLYDRDHTIGHSYFLNVKTKEDLDRVFKMNVIPLLQEYFYDDWERIQIVLGDHYRQFKHYDKLFQSKKDLINEKEDDVFRDSKNFPEKLKNEYRFIQSKKSEEKIVIGFDHDDIEDDKTEYKINDKFEPECYKKIYEVKKATNIQKDG